MCIVNEQIVVGSIMTSFSQIGNVISWLVSHIPTPILMIYEQQTQLKAESNLYLSFQLNMFYACKGNDACCICYDSYKALKIQKRIRAFKYKASRNKRK